MILYSFFAGLTILLLTTTTAAQNIANAAAAGKKHNVVFILTDDQDQLMNSLDHMPKVQNLLINEGTWYQRHYAPTALCCPARVSIWTGLHAHNHKVTDVSGKWGGWPKILEQGLNSKYLPIWLSNNGYKTFYAGKLYNGMSAKNNVEKTTARGWTQADLLCGEATYQYFNPPFQHINSTNWNNPNKINESFKGQYSTTKVAEYGYGYLREAVMQNDPFFVAIAPITPHVQVGKNHSTPVPENKYLGTRPLANISHMDNFNPVKRSGVNKVWDLDRLNKHQEHLLDEHYQARTEALLSVDDIVEQVVTILKNNNKLDDTYIIYSSDNGFHLGQHRLGAGKKYAFEEDTNVPLIIRGPGVPKGRKTSIVTAHVDLSPTILEMAGMAQRDEFDGRKIPITAEDLTKRENNDADEYANVEFWAGASYGFHNITGKFVNSYKSLRLAGKGYDISYTVHCHNNSHELYNLANDRVELRNLHPTAPAPAGGKNAFDSGDTELAGFPIPKLLKRIDAALLVLKSCQGNSIPCNKPWAQLHPNANVNNLRDAMNNRWDENYDNWYSKYKVRFTKCYKNGKIDIGAEGPQWTTNGPTDGGHATVLFNDSTNPDDWSTPSDGIEADENWVVGDDGEEEGWWDDWE
ncbi:alkaline phosphatase-like protein [Melanomma pulvis-pyrius CBS 109.77]|uniref:Alkaline phosphatase-like protein n=1 Tax=Melanomma pulvis-pyrius CBS 109.77 TaxID=1314802 RepID=A0A6A6XFA8_9PLEO|nr:alkaline phosphatase-like protein [Melanomma pulvis-pyrius CBS 109.77]